jgi:hypothetical protein
METRFLPYSWWAPSLSPLCGLILTIPLYISFEEGALIHSQALSGVYVVEIPVLFRGEIVYSRELARPVLSRDEGWMRVNKSCENW